MAYIVKQEGSQLLHHPSILHGLDILWTGCGIGHSLDEGNSGLLIHLKVLDHRHTTHGAANQVLSLSLTLPYKLTQTFGRCSLFFWKRRIESSNHQVREIGSLYFVSEHGMKVLHLCFLHPTPVRLSHSTLSPPTTRSIDVSKA